WLARIQAAARTPVKVAVLNPISKRCAFVRIGPASSPRSVHGAPGQESCRPLLSQRQPPPAEYPLESKSGPDDCLPIVAHAGGRTIRQGRRTPSAISAQQARVVLTDPVIMKEHRQ
ncbi:hypothetical protein, partial [Streptomyces sp. SID685]|uniref:hypothetical protein n=1 Tax=Streptomyces sp. SID685 TaxID=2690322 RepID=UPI001F3FBF63